MFICNFCNEECCYLAETESNTFICPTCWTFSLCVKALELQGEKSPYPCKDLNCGHKPVLKSKFKRLYLEKEKEQTSESLLDNIQKEEGRRDEEQKE
jgi:hypothetical protein